MGKQIVKKIFEDFAELLDKRLEHDKPLEEKVLTTEDSVRYTLFASMLQNEIGPNEIILEYPHCKIDGARIDTWVSNFGANSVAIEFKYDRPGTSKTMINKTARAGAVFADLRRLQLACFESPVECYFVYVTSIEMHKYFKNNRNRHDNFYNLSPECYFEIRNDYFDDRPKSFLEPIEKIEKKIKIEMKVNFEAKITSVLALDLPQEHYLRIYRVCNF